MSAGDALLLSALYLSMLLFGACVHSVDDSLQWPSLATRLFGDSFATTSDLIELWSSVTVVMLAVVGAFYAGLEWLTERRAARVPRQERPLS